MNNKFIGIIGAVAGCLIWVPAASAAVVTDVLLQEAGVNSGNPTDEGSSAIAAQTYGTFTGITVGGTYTGPPGIQFDSTTLSTSATSSGTLTVYVTTSGITSPLTASLLAELQSNGLPSGWTVTESILLNGTLIPGLSNAFSITGTVFDTAALSTTSPYTLTEEYVISANSTGTTTDNIELSSTPIPGTLPLFASGLVGFWAWSRKRKVDAKSLEASVA